jgi:hypothetical protein
MKGGGKKRKERWIKRDSTGNKKIESNEKLFDEETTDTGNLLKRNNKIHEK